MIQAMASAKRHPALASRQQPGEFMNFTASPTVHLIMRVRRIRKNRLALRVLNRTPTTTTTPHPAASAPATWPPPGHIRPDEYTVRRSPWRV
jgi:hypothetical protein